MLKQDINSINRAMRAIGRGDKELAADYLVDAYNGTRSKQIRELVVQIRELHQLRELFYAICYDRKQQKVVTVPKGLNSIEVQS